MIEDAHEALRDGWGDAEFFGWPERDDFDDGVDKRGGHLEPQASSRESHAITDCLPTSPSGEDRIPAAGRAIDSNAQDCTGGDASRMGFVVSPSAQLKPPVQQPWTYDEILAREA